MRRSVVVLGVGRVGSAIALDLAGEREVAVTAIDGSEAALGSFRERAHARGLEVRTVEADLEAPRLDGLLQGHDLAIGAVPGPLGFATLGRVIEAGVDVVDLSFFEEDALELHERALRLGRVAIVDAGIAPGLSNLVLGHWEARLRSCRRFRCLVGGLPAEPVGVWGYRAPFSPVDVIAEYTRPARIRRDGRDVVLPALSELEAVDIPPLGTLEAFNTDGLRTLLRTSRVPDMVEKTLRWPGHADRVRLLRDSGFFGTGPVPLEGGPVRPIDLSSALLFEAWRYRPGEEDVTVMRITVDGEDATGPVRHTLELLDRYDRGTGTSSMARTTGYTATAIARLVLDGHYREPGIAPPERLGSADGVLDRVLRHLTARGVTVHRSEQRGGPDGRGPVEAPGPA